jgi:hypothetical protein
MPTNRFKDKVPDYMDMNNRTEYLKLSKRVLTTHYSVASKTVAVHCSSNYYI